MNLKAYINVTTSTTQVFSQCNGTDVIATLNNYESVTLIDENNEWYQISFNNSTGWVPASSIFIPLTGITYGNNPAEEMPPTLSNPYAGLHINGLSLEIIGQSNSYGYRIPFNNAAGITYLSASNIRIGIKGYILFKQGPFTDIMSEATWYSTVLGTLTNSTEVFITAESNGWYQIKYNNSFGWVPITRVYCPSNNFISLPGTISTNCSLQGIPSNDSTFTIKTCTSNTTIHIIDINDGWYHVIDEINTGWIQIENISINTKAFIAFQGGPFTDIMSEATWYSTVLGTLNNCTEIFIIGENNGWFELSFNGVSGWVPINRVYIETNNLIPVKGTITNNTTIQSAPCSNSDLTITPCTISQTFTIIAQSNGWYQVKYNNSIAWISCSDIKLLTY